jgi:hypothetical protein
MVTHSNAVTAVHAIRLHIPVIPISDSGFI